MRAIILLAALSLTACAAEEPTEYEALSEAANLSDTSPDTPTFMGYDCTDDCSGHEAGYEWAEEQGVTHPDDCSGNSDSFIEGCQAYAEEHGGDFDPYEGLETPEQRF